MAYVEGRLVHDADSHLMELGDCLDAYFDSRLLRRFHELPAYRAKIAADERIQRARSLQVDPAFRAGVASELLLRKMRG